MLQEENIEELIEEVERRPTLYDKTIKDYANINVKRELWQEICSVVVPGWSELSPEKKTETGRDIQKKWQNLRSCFSRELRAQEQTKSGQSASKRRKYIYFEKLLFLLPTTETNVISDDDGDKEEGIDHVNEAENRAKSFTEEKRNKQKPFEESLLNNLSSRNTDDENVHFALSLVPSLKKLGEDKNFERD
ncbi:hypothetical protein L798_01970 [Zootermopsis nevadensis]|uniref:MADF domain-containing protein n=2 Tax=Zootermopsis nevadensis TaxID=136037 RepID=A0A067QVH3_ZOONE|nr:hypothetical protein L798_01970 [Zootermopsis nevadensis]